MRFANLPPHFALPLCETQICHRILRSLCRRDLPPKFLQLLSPAALRTLRAARCAQGVPFSESAPQTPRRSRSVACRSSAPCFRGAVHGRPTAAHATADPRQPRTTQPRCAALHFCAAPLRGNARRIRHRPPRIYSTVYSRVAHNGQPAFYGYSLRVPISECADISL